MTNDKTPLAVPWEVSHEYFEYIVHTGRGLVNCHGNKDLADRIAALPVLEALTELGQEMADKLGQCILLAALTDSAYGASADHLLKQSGKVLARWQLQQQAKP